MEEKEVFVHLGPSKEKREVKWGRGGEGEGGGEGRNVKFLPSICHALRTGLVNRCQINNTGNENSRGCLIHMKKRNGHLSPWAKWESRTGLHSYLERICI